MFGQFFFCFLNLYLNVLKNCSKKQYLSSSENLKFVWQMIPDAKQNNLLWNPWICGFKSRKLDSKWATKHVLILCRVIFCGDLDWVQCTGPKLHPLFGCPLDPVHWIQAALIIWVSPRSLIPKISFRKGHNKATSEGHNSPAKKEDGSLNGTHVLEKENLKVSPWSKQALLFSTFIELYNLY